MIERKIYLEKLIRSKNNGFPKVITGVRRCGKSYLLRNIYRNYLIAQGVGGEDILYLDLDEAKNAYLRNPLELESYVRKWAEGKERSYVFLDEIQRVYPIVNPSLTGGKIVLAKKSDPEIVSFVDVTLGLSHESNIDLYITGSNSKMLSSDIVTEFRDKATNIPIAPLSFEEYFSHAGGSSSEALYSYMVYGGMPLVIDKEESERKEYLKSLFETTYFKDIIEHNNLHRSEDLDEITNILSDCSGELLNSEKITNTFKSRKKVSIDKSTVGDYIGYFKDAFLVREAKRYDVRGRKEIGALRKYYFVDTGLRNARLDFAFDDEGQMLENVIYNELIYNGYSVSVGTFDSVEKDNGKSIRKTNEIDFYAKKGNRIYYIQVASEANDEKTRWREKRALSLLKNHVSKVLVLNKPIGESRDEDGIIIIGAVDFLLRFIK